MPASNNSVGGSMAPGLTLQAWALIDLGGNIRKSSGITSVVRNSAGTFTLTLTAPITASHAFFDARANLTNSTSSAPVVSGYMSSTTTAQVQTSIANVLSDLVATYIGIYA